MLDKPFNLPAKCIDCNHELHLGRLCFCGCWRNYIAMPSPICFRCGKRPDELDEYAMVKEPNQTADQFVREEEGTFNLKTNQFVCTACYIAIGQPSFSAPRRWCAP